jgi:hypothetical protein
MEGGIRVKRGAVERRQARETCAGEIRAARKLTMLQANFGWDLGICEIDRLVNDRPNNPHTVPMRFEPGQPAR